MRAADVTAGDAHAAGCARAQHAACHLQGGLPGQLPRHCHPVYSAVPFQTLQNTGQEGLIT